MLDLIGFQTYHDSRHFLSACTRILALDSHPKGVEWAGHRVIVDIFPVGIDPSVLERLREDPAVKRRAEELRSTFAGKKIITGRDRLDTIKVILRFLKTRRKYLSLYY
jgi:trehalose-6-phosphate synthase